MRNLFFTLLWLACLIIWQPSVISKSLSHDQEYTRGMRALEENDLDTAVDALRRAKELDPKDLGTRKYLGGIYRQLHQFTQAEREYQDLMRMDPHNLTWQLELATTYQRCGKPKQAVSEFQEVLAKDPNNLLAKLGMGICLEGSDDLDSAKDYYLSIMHLAPNTREAKTAEGRLSRISGAISARQANKFFPIDPELGKAGLGWWDMSKMPIHVYIDQGNNIPGYQDSMHTQVIRALETWGIASNGHFHFVIDAPNNVAEQAWKDIIGEDSVYVRINKDMSDVPDDPIPSQLHVHWVEDLTNPPPHYSQALGLAWTSVLGKKKGDPEDSIITKAHLWIATNRLADGKPLPDTYNQAYASIFDSHSRMVQEVLIHELGHTLGLTHSSNPNDIMCGGIFGLNAVDLVESRQLSHRDIKSLLEHYNNFQGNGLPAQITNAQDKAKKKTVLNLDDETTKTKSANENRASKEITEGPIDSDSIPAPIKYEPLKDIIFDFNCKDYDLCRTKLLKILTDDPKHAQAHYLLAATYVMLHRIPEAVKEYKEVIKLAPNTSLSDLAREGLRKLHF